MATDGRMTAVTLLFFATFTQGLHSVNLYHTEWINAAVGQSVSLPCMKEENHSYSITQMEWKKSVDHQEHKIVVFNPSFPSPHKYWANISLQLEGSGKNLRGSTLELHNVRIFDSGRYVCELTTYPHGTLKAITHLQVTDVNLFARVKMPNRHLREGDEVTILCNSTPPADSYSLWPSKKKTAIIKNTEGRFVLHNVTRDDSDMYICKPESLRAGLSFHSHNVTIQVTVNYLDEIKCDTNSSIEVAAGHNVSISCASNASQSFNYTWKKGNETVSASNVLNLPSVSSEQAGMYTLTVIINNNVGLQRQATFNITVRSDLMPSTTSPTSTTANVRSIGTTFWRSNITTAMGKDTPGSTSPPPRFTSTAPGLWPGEIQNASTKIVSTPSAADGGWGSEVNSTATTYSSRSLNGTLPPFDRNGTGVQEGDALNPGSPTAVQDDTIFTLATGYPASNSVPTETSRSDNGNSSSKRYVVFILLPVLALLLVILYLYRRHVIQRRMDLPPPFKPPPPPVKYSSVRTQEVPMTDILKR
ncbi:hypothetical protein MATL_G00048960 [Megalops atlanticus]|uniref:Ig-like domain-containing protein n=1 Tax=Megalops atlanticus TaxID=7932 RepID=A0A9D3QA18_MEGAT|nr:hypothetical protein MATL_G00048960 [Megalops atlanticus]